MNNMIDLKETAMRTVEKVRESEYKTSIKLTDDGINNIGYYYYYPDIELPNGKHPNGKMSEFFNTLNALYAEKTRGITLKDPDILTILKNEREPPYKAGDIIIFMYPNPNEEEDKSVLTHELMHALFKGIPNNSDKGKGYDEACTDYLAEKFYTGKSYFTAYKELIEKASDPYLKYYKKFLSLGEKDKQEILKSYFAGKEVIGYDIS